jgi:MFS family permease
VTQSITLTHSQSHERELGIGRGIIFLLALMVFINYVDRGNLATAVPLIKSELRLSNTSIGFLLSAFFWTYTPGQLLAAWLAEKINAYRTLALGLAIWSLATTLSGLASGFVLFLLLRLILGLGESVAFPCSSKLFAEHLPTHRLGAANGLVGVGLALGPAFGTVAGGLMMARSGWRATFIVFGLASMLWLVPWLLATGTVSRHADAKVGEAVPSFLTILRQPDAWGASLGHFCANYAFYFFISWLPLYLVRARGFTLDQMAEAGGLIYIVHAVSSQATGLVSDAWIRSGASDTLVRKTFSVAAHIGMAVCMLVCATSVGWLSLASLFLAGIFFGLNTPSIYCIGQTLAGPRVGGKWIALQNCVGNCAGILAPIITGYVADRTGQFALAFLIAGGFALLGAVGWGVIIRRVEPVRWLQASAG